ncbi:MAG: hypothetical protein V3Q69_01640 [Burkholderia sp.]
MKPQRARYKSTLATSASNHIAAGSTPARHVASTRRCCINRARSVDVYAQRSRGQPPIKSDSRVTA